MNVFLTGGTGYLGSAVLGKLVEKHDVTALVRSETSRAAVEKMGARPHLGDLGSPESWQAVAAAADCSVNVAADFSDYHGIDKRAVLALLEAARSSKKARRVIYTSGCLVLGEQKEPADENVAPDPNAPGTGWRVLHEQIVLKSAGAPISTAVIRPGWVFGGSGGGLNEAFFGAAEKEGAATYVGSGENRWPMIHREDLALLYAMMVDRWHEGIFHAANENAKLNLLAAAASLAAGKQGHTRSIPVEEARKTMGPFADAQTLDNPMAVTRSRELYGWKPKHGPFIESAPQLFKEWKGA